MSLLQICTDACSDIPLAVPTSIVGNPDETAVTLLTRANLAGEALARAKTGGWVAMIRENDFVTSAILPQAGTVANSGPNGTAVVSGITITPSMASLTWYGFGTGIPNNSIVSAVSDGGLDSAAILLLHCDGTNGSTSFPDSSNSANVVTAHGSATVSTAQSEFGGASAAFHGDSGGTVDWLSIPSVQAFMPGGDFTVDCWYRRGTANAAGPVIIGKLHGSFGTFLIRDNGSGGADFFASSTALSWDIASGQTFGTFAANTWVHIAVVRSGNSWFGFLNGVQGFTFTSSAMLYQNSGDPLLIGSDGLTVGRTINGFIDEIRFSSVARWTAAFTPPTAAYALSSVTLNQAANQTGAGTFQFGQSDYPLPSDFQRPIDNTMWDRSRFWSMRGPLSPQQWQLFKSSVIGRASIQRRYRFRYTSGAQVFSVDPCPLDNGSAFVWEYVSNAWCQSASGTPQKRWAADTDTGILDEYLIMLGLRWRMLRRLGMSYQEELSEYSSELKKAIAMDGSMAVLDLTPADHLTLIGPWNLPETNFGGVVGS